MHAVQNSTDVCDLLFVLSWYGDVRRQSKRRTRALRDEVGALGTGRGRGVRACVRASILVQDKGVVIILRVKGRVLYNIGRPPFVFTR